MKEEQLKCHIMLHEDKQYSTSKQNIEKLASDLFKTKNKEESINY